MAKTWQEVRKNIKSISDSEKVDIRQQAEAAAQTKDLDTLLTQWNKALQREFSPAPESLVALEDQILLADRIISAVIKERDEAAYRAKISDQLVTAFQTATREDRKEREETTAWLAQYDIPYDCAWRDAVDELIQVNAIEDDLAVQFFNALNDAGVKYRISTDGSMDYPNEEEKARGEAILTRIEAEANEGIQRCRVCGCTDCNACPGGCYWVEADLCSACVGLD